MSWGNNDKGFGFALSAWSIVATVTGYICGVSLILNALVAGNGSYILWPLVALTWRSTIQNIKGSNVNTGKSQPTFCIAGLSHAVFKGIVRKGYKVPTPIQRKTIPLIMDGKYISVSSKYVLQCLLWYLVVKIRFTKVTFRSIKYKCSAYLSDTLLLIT